MTNADLKLKCVSRKIIGSAPRNLTLALTLFLMTLLAACGQAESTSGNLRFLKSLKAPFSLSTPPAWSPNGHEIAAGSLLDKRVLVWDINNGKILRTLDREIGGVNALAYSPDGKFLAVGRGFVQLDKAHLNIYDAVTGKLLRNFVPPTLTMRGRGNDVNALAFSPDSRLLAVNGYGSGSIVAVYDVATGNVVAKLDSPTKLTDIVYSIAYSPDGKCLAIGRLSGTLELKDTKTWSTLRMHHEPILKALSFSPDSKYLAVGSRPNKSSSDNSSLPDGSNIHILDCSTFKHVKDFLAYRKTAVASLRYTPDGKLLLIGGAPAKIIDANTGRIVREIKFSPTVHHPSSSPDGRLISVASRQKVQLWEVR